MIARIVALLLPKGSIAEGLLLRKSNFSQYLLNTDNNNFSVSGFLSHSSIQKCRNYAVEPSPDPNILGPNNRGRHER